MRRVDVLIFHRPSSPDDAPLTAILASAREMLVRRHEETFARAGARSVRAVTAPAASQPAPFGHRLAELASQLEPGGGVVVLSSGAVPLLRGHDASHLVAAAGMPGRRALTNNRYSSDVCAVSDAAALAALPRLPSDNALPRWLGERAGFDVAELRARERLSLDLDTPLDLAVVALDPRAPAVLRTLAAEASLAVPRLAELRDAAADRSRELLVFGRTGSRTLAWLERNVPCRVRFLAEERGLRASSPLATASTPSARQVRPARATLGRLLHERGPAALSSTVAELSDAALVDSRVLLADRLGKDESLWPSPEDRFASDLHRISDIRDPWLRALTESAAGADIPILLGGHTLVGAALPVLLRSARPAAGS